MAAQLTCPHCRRVLTFAAPVPTGAKVRCAGCGRPFVNASRTAAGGDQIRVAAPFAPPPTSALPVAPVVGATPPARRGHAAIVLGVTAGLLVTAAVVGALCYFPRLPDRADPGKEQTAQLPPDKEPPPQDPANDPAPPKTTPADPVVVPKTEPEPKKQEPEPKKGPEPKPKPEPEPKKVNPAPPPAPKQANLPGVEPALQKQIDRAVERGVAYLVGSQSQRDSLYARLHPLGYAALRGLTLLECGKPRGDALITATAQEVRNRVIQADQTYEVALAVLFLDKLGDAGDEKLIQRLALRLAAVQNLAGGWGYGCPAAADSFADELLECLRQDRAHRLAKKGDPAAAKPPAVPDRFRQLALFAPPDAEAPARGPGGRPDSRLLNDDNSNTQFALLALWAARRHGVPLERCFARSERRFRQSQIADGGWSYKLLPGNRAPSTNSMTCVGLLGLAIGRGTEYELLHLDRSASGATVQKLTAADDGIQKGLRRLGQAVGAPTGKAAGLPMQNLYFLWSVERVAVLYGLPTIGDKDWYRWGVEILLANQQQSGAWLDQKSSMTDASIDTCFALLFLRRANLAPDLTRSLRLYIPVTDPDRRGGGNP